jgi:hypothetical protein
VEKRDPAGGAAGSENGQCEFIAIFRIGHHGDFASDNDPQVMMRFPCGLHHLALIKCVQAALTEEDIAFCSGQMLKYRQLADKFG